MDEQERLNLEDRLADVLRRDLSSISVRPFAVYNDSARAVMVSPLRRAFSVARAGAVLAIVVLVTLVAVFVLRELRPTPATTPVPSIPASASPSPSPATIVAPSPSPTAPTAAPSAVTTGTIIGRLGYPSDFVPPLTVYAISVSDASVWFSTDTPRFGNPLSATPPPGGPTWPPAGPGTYSISGIKPGTYFVIAYRNDSGDFALTVAAYTQYAAKCASSDPNVASPPPGPCPYDHSPVPVTVTAGQMVSHIDIVDWFGKSGNYPPRPR